MKYKGTYYGTVQESDLHGVRDMDAKRWHILKECLGNIQPRDVGKQIWFNDGIYQIENDEQKEARLNGNHS
jgi:hypothetical protein